MKSMEVVLTAAISRLFLSKLKKKCPATGINCTSFVRQDGVLPTNEVQLFCLNGFFLPHILNLFIMTTQKLSLRLKYERDKKASGHKSRFITNQKSLQCLELSALQGLISGKEHKF